MLYTLKVNSGVGEWMGYQIIAGVGAGAGVQIPFIAVQVVLSDKDMPTGSTFTLNTLSNLFNAALSPISLRSPPRITLVGRQILMVFPRLLWDRLTRPPDAIVFFFNSLGGAIAISIAQNIFVNSLSRDIPKLAPGVNPKIVIGAGATHVRDVVPAQWLPGVLQAYTNAVTSAFILAIAAGGIAFFVSWAMELKSVKGKKLLPGGGA